MRLSKKNREQIYKWVCSLFFLKDKHSNARNNLRSSVEDMESKAIVAVDRFAFRRTGCTSADVANVVAMLVCCRGHALS